MGKRLMIMWAPDSSKPFTSTAIGLACLINASWAFADMKSLDDTALANISGQSGLTMELELALTADRLSYYDDDKGIHLEGFRVGSAIDSAGQAFHLVRIDIEDDASLNLDYLVEDRRVEFGDIRLAGAPGVSMGGRLFRPYPGGISEHPPGWFRWRGRLYVRLSLHHDRRPPGLSHQR